MTGNRVVVLSEILMAERLVPLLLRKVAIRIVNRLPVMRVKRYNPSEAHMPFALARGGFPVALIKGLVIWAEEFNCTSASICVAVVISPALPAMERNDH